MKKKTKLKRVLILAGGTGGHVFPGLSVAQYLREQGVEVHWMGTSKGLESRLVPEAQIPLHLITITGLRGKGMRSLLAAPFKVTTAIIQAIRIIKRIQPDVVLGMGGFVSGPGGIATWLTQTALIIHEQNAKAGFTNKILTYFAQRVLAGFPNTFKPQKKVLVVGNPVRTEIENLLPPQARLNTSRVPYRLLVLGGSQGAQALNEIVPKALTQLAESERPEILHQTGDKHFDVALKHYQSINIEADLKPFLKDMAQAYAWADLVLCRSGALTVAELCSAGVGAIFVPFPYAVDDHQTANANLMVKSEAALCIQQHELTENRLAQVLSEFSHTPEKRMAMAQAAYQLRKVKVTEKIFDILSEVVE